MKKIILGIAFLFTVVLNAQVTIESVKAKSFGNGIVNFKGENNSWSIKMGSRMQLLSSNSWLHNNGELSDQETAALVRRSRLKFDGFVYSPKVKFKLELGLSNNDLSGFDSRTKDAPRMVLDAVVMWNFTGNFTVWFGQTKLPGNLERVISSANLQLVDRSKLNSEFTIDREFGLQLRHHNTLGENFVVREKIAIAQGEGRNVTIDNVGGYHYMGRVELLPFGLFQSKGDYKGGDLKREQKPKLMLASTYSFNDNASKDKGSQGKYFSDLNDEYIGVTTDVSTLFIDGMFKYKGFSLMGEYAKRDARANIDNLVRVGSGLNLASGYLFKNNWEVAGRYTNINLDQRETRDEYTLGVSRYIVGHKLKIQSDITYADRTEYNTVKINNRLGFRFQVEIQL